MTTKQDAMEKAREVHERLEKIWDDPNSSRDEERQIIATALLAFRKEGLEERDKEWEEAIAMCCQLKGAPCLSEICERVKEE